VVQRRRGQVRRSDVEVGRIAVRALRADHAVLERGVDGRARDARPDQQQAAEGLVCRRGAAGTPASTRAPRT
jgi:hypothetical protein